MSRNFVRRMMQIFISELLQGAILFVAAGTIRWFWAWIYLACGILIITCNALVLPTELIEERGRKKENVEKWDKIITSIATIPLLTILLVAGLDLRFGWSQELRLGWRIAGIIIFLVGNFLFTWAMASNYYFSTAVRLQYDREHKVATAGPYQFMRHPGYLGFILFTMATPLILGSWWAYIPAGSAVLLFILRTYLEDKTLQHKLEGYQEYAAKVRYRLLPGIW